MTKILCLLALCLTAVAGLPRKERIVNGSFATIEQYPFLASLLFANDNNNFRHHCGGTIVNNRSVVTAAQCITGLTSQFRVRVGSTFANSGGNIHIASSILIHPDYIEFLYHLDIALVRVTTAFTFGSTIQPSRIAGPNYIIGNHRNVWVAGWGSTSADSSQPSPSENLRHVQINTVTQGACAQIFGTFFKPFMICAGGGGFGICSGDIGGPLIHTGTLVGVATAPTVPCGSNPAAFVQLASASIWIQNNR